MFISQDMHFKLFYMVLNYMLHVPFRPYCDNSILNLIKKILIEWSYRLDDGMIDLENYTHLSILREVLSDMKIPSEVIIEVMGNITEKEAFFSLGVLVYNLDETTQKS